MSCFPDSRPYVRPSILTDVKATVSYNVVLGDFVVLDADHVSVITSGSAKTL